MKTLIIVLIIAAFLQTTIIPIDLVLLVLICRAYIRSGKENLYLAFGFGMLTAHLNLNSLGIRSMIYLVAVCATQILSKRPLSGNPLLILPISLVVVFLNEAVGSYVNHQTMELTKVIIAGCLSLPIVYAVRLWEERFIIQKEIKLRV